LDLKKKIEPPAGNNGDTVRFPISFVTASDAGYYLVDRRTKFLRNWSTRFPIALPLRAIEVTPSIFSDPNANSSRRKSGRVSFSIPLASWFDINIDPGTRSGDVRHNFHEVRLERLQMNPGVPDGKELPRRSNLFHGYRGAEDFATLRSKAFVQLCKTCARDKQISGCLARADSMSLAEVEQNYISACENLNFDPETADRLVGIAFSGSTLKYFLKLPDNQKQHNSVLFAAMSSRYIPGSMFGETEENWANYSWSKSAAEYP
jgi:hypothetical protein